MHNKSELYGPAEYLSNFSVAWKEDLSSDHCGEETMTSKPVETVPGLKYEQNQFIIGVERPEKLYQPPPLPLSITKCS